MPLLNLSDILSIMKGFRSLTSKYIFISLILLSCIGIYVYAGFLFTQHLKGDGRKMSLAGKERALTLNMAFHTLLIIELPPSLGEDVLMGMAEKAMNEYEAILHGLKYGDPQLELIPIPGRDKESVSNINILIETWEKIQKPTFLSLMRLPVERKNESCGMCHSAIRENMGKINDLVRSLEKDYENEIRQFDRFRMYTLGVFLAVGIFIVLYVRRNLVMPVIVLRDAASQVEKGHYNVRIDVEGSDEIGELSRSFNQMAQALDTTFSENKRLVERLEDAKLTAEAASQAKSEFLANMSHELRTPLTAVIGFSEIIKDGMAGPVTDEQKEYLADIMESGQHLLDLINDILDLSKVEAGKMELEPSEFNFKELIERSLIMFKEKAFKHKIDLSYYFEDNIGDIFADERRLRQVIFNLLSNAVKFTPDGGKVTVTARRIPGEPEQIECSVEDTGIGIREEDRPRLFHPFEQLASVLTKEHTGTGLGLALCKRIVELHGGRIWVEGEFGKGSRFTFIFPVRR